MSAYASVDRTNTPNRLIIRVRFYLVVDPVLPITPREVRNRAQATFGSATLPASQLMVPHFPWPRAYRRGEILLSTTVVSWYGVRESVRQGDVFNR